MEYKLLEKSQTGIASEYYVAGELARMGFNVTLTFGNTKSIDLLIEKDGTPILVQVKGIQRTKSICWNLDKNKIKNGTIYVLVNLHSDHIDAKPEFFILTSEDAKRMFKDTKKEKDRRTYLDYNSIKNNLDFKNNWSVFYNRIQSV